MCVHPAFSGYLGDVAAALDPVAAIAGLPGAPVRAEQVASVGTWPSGYEPSHTASNPPVLEHSGEEVGDLFGVFWGIPAGAGRTGAPDSSRVSSAGMCGLAIALLQLGAAGESLNQGILVLARNVTGITGIGLLCSLVTGGLLAWALPMGYLAFCQYALLQGWTAPWTWPVRPPADRGAWICACAVFTAGLLLFTIRGARTRSSATKGSRIHRRTKGRRTCRPGDPRAR